MSRYHRMGARFVYWVVLVTSIQLFTWHPIIAEEGINTLYNALSLTVQSSTRPKPSEAVTKCQIDRKIHRHP